MSDITKNTMPTLKNASELAEELLAQFPDIDRAVLLKKMVACYFFDMRYGNKREEKAACDFLNQLQVEAGRLTP